MSVASLMASVSLAFAVSLLLERYRRFRYLILFPTVALILGTLLFGISTILAAKKMPLEEFYQRQVDNRSEEGCACWWPVWANKEAFENRERVTAIARNVEVSTWGAETRRFDVGAGQPEDVRVATFYYPYWKATVNDQPAEVKMDENGVILIPVGSEAAKVHLYFEEPFINRATLLLSLLTWAGLLIGVGKP